MIAAFLRCAAFSVLLGCLAPLFAISAADDTGKEKAETNVDYMKVCVLVVANGDDKLKSYVSRIESGRGGCLRMQIVKDKKEADPAECGFFCVLELKKASGKEKLKSIGGGYGAPLSGCYCSGAYNVFVSSGGKWKKLGGGALTFWEKITPGIQVSSLVLSEAIKLRPKPPKRGTEEFGVLKGAVSTSLPLLFEGIEVSSPFTTSVSGWTRESGDDLPPVSIPAVGLLEPNKSESFTAKVPMYYTEQSSSNIKAERGLFLYYSWKDAYVLSVQKITIKVDASEGDSTEKETTDKVEE